MSIAYQLKRSSKRKTLSIKISDGQVIVYSPYRLSKAVIDGFIEQKKDWIFSHVAQQRGDRAQPVLLHETLSILEQNYLLRFVPNQKESAVLESGNTLTVKTSKRVKKYQDKQLSLITAFCSQKLTDYCHTKAIEYAKKIGKQPNKVSVKLFKRRWGACDNKRNLQFNTQLATAPLWVIDYVIAHEVAHLIELNHSHKFWQIVSGLYQDIDKAEKWLKLNGKELDIFKKE